MGYQVVESPVATHSSNGTPPASPRKSVTLDCSVSQRLDALQPRLSWFYVRLLLLVGLSWAVQASEAVLFIFTRVLVANDIGMGTPVLEIVGASVFMGAVAGGPIFGHVADSFGRRLSLLIAMALSLGGLAISSRTNAEYMLIIGHVITGLGLGGQITTTTVLVHELSPASMSGRMIALLDAFTGIGGLIGLVLSFAVAPRLEWRTTYLVVCGFALYGGVLRFTIPESPRWLANVGRTDDAQVVIERIERSHGLQGLRVLCDDVQTANEMKTALVSTSTLTTPTSPTKTSIFKKFTHPLAVWTLWIIVTLSSYALGIYVPTVISLNGYNMFASWGTIAVLNVAQVLGSLLAATVLDSCGRQRSFAVFAASAAIISVVLSYVPWSRAWVITSTVLVTASLSGCWSCVLACSPEHFKTHRRARGVGYAVGVSRAAAVGGFYLYPQMFNVWVMSVPSLCWLFGGLLTVVAAAVMPSFGRVNEDAESCRAGVDVESGLGVVHQGDR